VGHIKRLWFDRAVASQFDYIPAYSQFEHSLSPAWGPGYQIMYEFGLECLNTQRFDTKVPGRFVEAVWDIAEDWGTSEWWRRPDVYANLQTAFEGILAGPWPDEDLAHYKSMYAAMAWRSGHYEDARRLFDELGDQLDNAVFPERFKTPVGLVRGQVYAATGPLGKKVQRAEALYFGGEVERALPLFEKALRSATDEEVVSYLRDRVVTLRIKVGLAQGDWVDIMPEKGLAGWQSVRGSWNLEPDGSLAGREINDCGTLIACNAPVEGNFEIQGEIELPPDRGEGGVIPRIKNPDRINWTTFRIDVAGSQAMIGRCFYSPTEDKQIQLKPLNTFLVQVWYEQVIVYLNGELVFPDYEFEPVIHCPAKGQVGLGARHGEQFDAPTRYRNVQIRRLTTKPVPQPSE